MISMEQIFQVLVPVVVGAVIALAGPFIHNWITKKREREQDIWRKQLEKFIELEERIGYLTEWLSGYRNTEANRESLVSEFSKVDRLSGTFRRYSEITQAVRDFLNSAGWILSKEGRFDSQEERDETVKELEIKYQSVLAACDRVIGRKL